MDASRLVQATLERLQPVIAEAVTLSKDLWQKREFRGRAQRDWPEHQAYDIEVFNRCAAVSTTFDRLADTERFILRMPRTAELRDERMPPQRWILYHYSFHSVLVTSLLDLASLLTNSVLRLGYSERRCSYETLAENSWVRQYGVKPRLLAIRHATQKHRERRNRFVHRGEDIDIGAELQSNTYDRISLAASAGALSQTKVLEDHVVDLLFTVEMATLVSRMEAERLALVPPMQALFDQLAPHYEATAARLHRRSG